MSFLESSSFWSIALSVIGILVSFLFFYLSTNRKKLGYRKESTKLITKNMADNSEIGIMLNGQRIENIVSSTVKFINTGNQTIMSDDFATLEPLGISVSGRFFNTSQTLNLDSNNPNLSSSVEIVDEKNIRIEFDFLKPKQYISVKLLHDGELTILGELKSGTEIKEEKDPDNYFCFVSETSAAILFLMVWKESMNITNMVTRILCIIAGLICCISMLYNMLCDILKQ